MIRYCEYVLSDSLTIFFAFFATAKKINADMSLKTRTRAVAVSGIRVHQCKTQKTRPWLYSYSLYTSERNKNTIVFVIPFDVFKWHFIRSKGPARDFVWPRIEHFLFCYLALHISSLRYQEYPGRRLHPDRLYWAPLHRCFTQRPRK